MLDPKLVSLIKNNDYKGILELLKTDKSFFDSYEMRYVIIYCIENNLISMLRFLSDHGLVIEDCYYPGSRSIFTYVNSLDMLIFLIDNDVTLDTLNIYIKKRYEIIEMFLSLERDLFLFFVKVGLKVNNIYMRIRNEHNLNLLLETNPDIETLTRWVFINQDASILEAIVRRYPELCSVIYKNKTVLEHALYKKSSLSFITFLFDNGMDINYIDIKGFSPFLYAVFYNRIDIIMLLYERGADINCKDKTGKNALFCTHSSIIINILLDLGIETKDIYCEGPMDCLCNRIDISTKIRLFDICVTDDKKKVTCR